MVRNSEFAAEVKKWVDPDPQDVWTDPNASVGGKVPLAGLALRFQVNGETRTYQLGQTQGMLENCENKLFEDFRSSTEELQRCMEGHVCH
jgi:hypothetical protein